MSTVKPDRLTPVQGSAILADQVGVADPGNVQGRQQHSAQSAAAPGPRVEVPRDPRTAERRRRLTATLVGALSIFCFLSIWEGLTRFGFINPWVFASPTMVFEELEKLIGKGTLIDHVLVSSRRVMIGFLLSVLIAIPLGVLLGSSRLMKAILDPITSVIRPLPSLSWIPLSILWLGIGEEQKYSIVFMGTFAPLLIFVTDATQRVDRTLIKAAQNLGASRLRIMAEVLLPGAMPSIASALKVTLAIAWACIISAEMVGATNGLGFLIWNAKDWGNISQVIVGMLTISATVVLLDALLKVGKGRAMPWLRNESKR